MKPAKKSITTKQATIPAKPSRVRTRFSKEFKLQAVELLELGQKNPTELAMELGIRRNQLYKWRDQLKSQELKLKGQSRQVVRTAGNCGNCRVMSSLTLHNGARCFPTPVKPANECDSS